MLRKVHLKGSKVKERGIMVGKRSRKVQEISVNKRNSSPAWTELINRDGELDRKICGAEYDSVKSSTLGLEVSIVF